MSTLYVDNLEPNLGSRVLAAGHVVQVVQVSGTNQADINVQNTYVQVAGTCSITPTTTSSKILISHTAGGLAYSTQSCKLRIKRNGSVILTNDRMGYNSFAADWTPMPWVYNYLDSPSTTSQVDYTFEIAQSSTGLLRHNDSDVDANTWTTMLMEIAQ